MSYVICKQQRHRSACTSAQSDQRLCCSLLRKYNISRFYSRNFKTLANFCGCADWFVSGLVGRYILSCRGSYKWAMETRGPKSNSSEVVCLSWLPATLMMIRSKMNELAWRHHFRHYESMGNCLDLKGS